MKHNPLGRRPLGALALASVLTAVLLTACSSKPPGCADDDTVNLVRSVYLDRWKQISAGYVKSFKMSPEETENYNNALKLEIRNIVSDGYNEGARKHSCKGVFVFTTLTGKSSTTTRAFTSQAAAEGGGKFLVQVEDVDFMTHVIAPDYNDYVMSKRK